VSNLFVEFVITSESQFCHYHQQARVQRGITESATLAAFFIEIKAILERDRTRKRSVSFTVYFTKVDRRRLPPDDAAVAANNPAAIWKASIEEDNIPLADKSINLDAVVGGAERRTLTHKGIEYKGLVYNSPELAQLRFREGPKLSVDIRVDESDIGKIYVLWPGLSQPYVVPALMSEYASGLSLWAHHVIKKQMRENADEDHNVHSWLETSYPTADRGGLQVETEENTEG
jgi:Mu transposase, C-terminal